MECPHGVNYLTGLGLLWFWHRCDPFRWAVADGWATVLDSLSQAWAYGRPGVSAECGFPGRW